VYHESFDSDVEDGELMQDAEESVSDDHPPQTAVAQPTRTGIRVAAPEKYSGSASQPWETVQEQMEVYFRANGLDRQMWALHAHASLLTGDALSVWNGAYRTFKRQFGQNALPGWTYFCATLKKYFGEKVPAAKAWYEWEHIQRRSGESILSFISRFQLARSNYQYANGDEPVGETQSISRFIYSSKLNPPLPALNPANNAVWSKFDHLLRFAAAHYGRHGAGSTEGTADQPAAKRVKLGYDKPRHGHGYGHGGGQNPKRNKPSYLRRRAKRAAALTVQTDSLPPPPPQVHAVHAQPTGKMHGNCFNCGKPGHFARDCRLPKQDFRRAK
jgi:hypothetical protein